MIWLSGGRRQLSRRDKVEYLKVTSTVVKELLIQANYECYYYFVNFIEYANIVPKRHRYRVISLASLRIVE